MARRRALAYTRPIDASLVAVPALANVVAGVAAVGALQSLWLPLRRTSEGDPLWEVELGGDDS